MNQNLRNRLITLGVLVVILILGIVVYRADVKAPGTEQSGPIDNSQPITNGTFLQAWQALTVKAGNFPADSWYRVWKSNSTNYLVSLYPHITDSDALGPYDYELQIAITTSKRSLTTPLTCAKAAGSNDLHDEAIQTGPYDVTIKHIPHFKSGAGAGQIPADTLSTIAAIDSSIQAGLCP